MSCPLLSAFSLPTHSPSPIQTPPLIIQEESPVVALHKMSKEREFEQIEQNSCFLKIMELNTSRQLNQSLPNTSKHISLCSSSFSFSFLSPSLSSSRICYEGNGASTMWYNPITFLPKNLWEPFHCMWNDSSGQFQIWG